MNLFENLQMLNESENKLVSEFRDFLKNKNAQYIANEIGETKDGMQIVIYDGDWKHEHLYMQRLINEFFENKGIDVFITSEEIGESDQDTYSAEYNIEFNAKPKEHSADVKSLKFTTEDIEDSFDNDGLLTELRTNVGPHNELRYEIIQDGVLLFHTTNKELAKEKFKEISKIVPKEYKKVNGKYKKFSGNGELASMWESKNIRYQVTCQLAISNEEIYSEHTTLKDAIASARKAQQSFMNVKIKDLEDGNSWYNIDDAEQDLNDGLYEGKHYSGAFDISDTAYFTRDDLDEFSNDVVEKLSNATHADIIADVVDCYLDEDTNELELTLSYNEYEHTHKEKIDMRKIKMPKDLIKVYSNTFVNDFLWSFTADMEHEEMIKEDYNDNAATFLDTLEDEIENAAKEYMISKCGFSEDEVDDYLTVTADVNDDAVVIHVGAELSYESLYRLGEELNKIIVAHDKDAYFEPETPGRLVAYLFGIKNESINKLEETNHNEILDTDYVTGEKLFNAIKDYLDSLDQIGMDGNDYNWQPSEFNAKNLEADGEIYLVNEPYILFYPYINEWAEDYFKVSVVESNELSTQLKNGIERIFNKFKTDKWQLIFED